MLQKTRTVKDCFCGTRPQRQRYEKKIRQIGLHKTTKLSLNRGNTQQSAETTYRWEKIFAMYTSGNGLESRCIRNSKNSVTKNKPN
jgi:hypothetical protein